MTSLPVQDRPTDLALYRAYVENKDRDSPKSVQLILEKFGISRGHFYNVVRRVERGNTAAIRAELENARFDILWRHKYKTRFLALPKQRGEALITELRLIVRAMDRDKFPQLRIAHYLEKDRSTIIRYLKNL